ncbi:BglG family transcription antiterminator [Isobaculum melis]|uniref:Transcriptional antiterminator n=1 Tax=Isobaculum melis TaxID=142588 RepID=A0A1H9TQI7_9LACT|nr:BglG family transcription antiterminator [Isobaculum melis]SER99284.1 Transcriptional antiterminator [Isobaculum melis]
MREIEITKRQFQLIRLLINNSEAHPVRYYSDKLNVSSRTIHHDLNHIEILLKDTSLILERKPRVGISIKGHADEKFKLLNQLTQSQTEVNNIPKERQFIILKKLLIEEETLSYQQLSELFMVSKSSISSDFDEIQKMLSSSKTVQLVSNSCGTFVEGNEEEWQKGLIQLNESYAKYKSASASGLERFMMCMKQLYDEKIVTTSFQLIKELGHKQKNPLADYYLINLLNVLIVLTYRAMQQKHHQMSNQNFIYKEVMNLKLYFISKKLLDDLSQQITVYFSEEDRMYFNQYIVANGVQSYVDQQEVVTSEFSKIVQQLIEKMSDSIKIDLSQDVYLYENLLAHFVPMLYRLKTQIVVKNPLLKSIKEEYSVMFSVTWFVMSMLEELYEIELTEDEVGFMMVHFQAALERNARSKKVLIICPTGIGTSELIANRIRRFLPALDIIEVVSLDKLYQNNIDEVDFIITTVPIKKLNRPIIHVSPLMSDVDIRNVSKFYTDVFLKDASIEDAEQEIDFPVLKKWIDERYIYTNQNFASKEEVFDFMTEKLVTDQIVEQEFRESLMQRELMGGTALNSGVAIPHGNPKNLKETKIFLLTNTTAIKWGEKFVHSIVMLCISEKDLKDVRDILNDIYQIVRTKDSVKRYLTGKTKNQLLEMVGGSAID